MGGWGPSNPFAERIEKPVQKNGPPLMTLCMEIDLVLTLCCPGYYGVSDLTCCSHSVLVLCEYTEHVGLAFLQVLNSAHQSVT